MISDDNQSSSSFEGKERKPMELAHVLFMDIVAYSKLPIDYQAKTLHQLQQIVRSTADFARAQASKQLICLPTGDGMALVFFGDPEAPVRCAIEISRALKNYPEVKLRMGVHSGPVSQIVDVNESVNVAGAGINMAQRVMDCGDDGHILLSKRMAEDLGHYSDWQGYLHDLGETEVKHGLRMHIVNFYNDGIGNPELPAKFKKIKKSSSPLKARFRPMPALAIAAVVIGIMIVIVVFKWRASVKGRTNTSSILTVNAADSRQFTNSIGMEFVWIPPGRFMMGSEKDDESPPHWVTIGTGFYMGKYEVTQGEWEAVMGVKKNPDDPIYFYGFSRRPVEWATWNDVMAFINKLNGQHDGYIYQLPSEAMWEYACRAGTTGDDAGDLDSTAWYGNNSGSEYLNATEIWQTDRDHYYDRINDNLDKTHPVGTKQPNPFGLFDMQGNVWEWCADWGNNNYEGAPLDGSPRLTGQEGTRVRRGGSWLSTADSLRCATRVVDPAGRKENDIGFRVVAVARQ